MSEVTVEKFSGLLGISTEQLLKQLNEAGVEVDNPEHKISDDDKMRLLSYLRRSHGKHDEVVIGEPKKITLRRKTQTELRMTGSHGRAKTVTVEVRKSKTYVKKSVIVEEENKRRQELAEELARKRKEQERALAELKKKEDEALAKQKVEEKAAQPVEEQPRKQAEDKAAAEQAAADTAGTEERKTKQTEVVAAEDLLPEVEFETQTEKKEERQDKKPQKQKTAAKKPAEKFERKELHIKEGKGGQRRKKRKHVSAGAEKTQHGFERPAAPVVKEVVIPETITVADLAQKMSVKAAEVIKVMMNMGSMVTINQSLDQETAMIVVEEMGHKVKLAREDAIEEQVIEEAKVTAEALPRAPVVTIMGHVDHGKTSLLDKIRSSSITAVEAGGITQHIGAYHVETENGMITFLDTPGHEAFTAMRARGSKITDIVVLVVAADDGVMPQTKEAIQHAKAAEVPIIVAVNKIDKPEANPDKVKQELGAEEVIPEDWGGDTMFVPVSAKTGEGIDELLESILLQAEIFDLKAPVDCPASGVVIEARLDKGRGVVTSVLVQKGTLKKGDILLAGMEYGRVRAMLDENGKVLDSAGPSIPVEILGLSGLPNAGDEAIVVVSEKRAREVAEFRHAKYRESKIARQQAAQLDNMFTQMESGDTKVLNLLIKADVHGSAEALRQALEDLSTDEVKVKIVSSGVGGINESDVNLAMASSAIIIGFNVRANPSSKRLIEEEGIQLKYYGVIYDAIDFIKNALTGMLQPEFKDQIIGLAEVRSVFRSSKYGQVAGCLVKEGVVRRSNPIRVLRDNVVIFEGELESLQRHKDAVDEVASGIECGIGVKNYNDIKVGDQIEVYERVEVARSL